MVATRSIAPPPDASRARHPDATGVIERDGVRIAWDRYGPAEPEDGRRTILLTPTWSIIHSRFWKAQIPYLARHYRVLTWDGRGNGRSDRPEDAAAYDDRQFVDDAMAVLDANATSSAVVVGLSMGAHWTLLLAADHAERVDGAVFIGMSLPLLAKAGSPRVTAEFFEERDTYEGWDRYNANAWRRDYDGFLDFFFAQCFTEPHSTKPIEDCVRWAHETDPETLIRTDLASGIDDRPTVDALAARVRCPVLVIHGTQDAVVGFRHGARFAELLGARLLAIEGGGHIPLARDPVAVNLALRSFVDSLPVRRP
ncbi:MAG TPA: alpha/beta hydrolase [Candidatus Limnocylindrales bacterium]|nr:alpha/beta hydrolase [Candidatus Limnocylindrales bacterium]